MKNLISRRQALKLGMAGAGFVLAPSIIRGQATPIVVAGSQVEIAIASVGPSTVRITVSPIADDALTPVPDAGALVSTATGTSVARRRVTFAPVRAGNLTVRFAENPPTIHIETAKGEPVTSRLRARLRSWSIRAHTDRS